MRSSKRSGGLGWTLTRACPVCGSAPCRCPKPAEKNKPQPRLFRLRLEKRRGKAVTVLSPVGFERPELEQLLRDLKATCGAGGTVKDEIELQGDHREKVREELANRGWKVKG